MVLGKLSSCKERRLILATISELVEFEKDNLEEFTPIEIDYVENDSVWDDDHYLVDWDY